MDFSAQDPAQDSAQDSARGSARSFDAIRLPPPLRRIFCNRTLNLRSIRAIGFDMDYTLIHYRIEKWERCAYDHLQQRLVALGWPVADLRFDPNLVSLGLILDLEHGNIVKANRFGNVRRACHGTRMLSFEEQKAAYHDTLVDLNEDRWVFLNTLFALSEACMYAQTVDLLDEGVFHQPLGYRDLYHVVRSSLDEAHMEGSLKAEIARDPGNFVELDPDLALALLDLKHAGKHLLLITNSEWEYTQAMMTYAFDHALPGNMVWRDLFDLIIVQAGKPSFFTGRPPIFELVDDQKGLVQPLRGKISLGKTYLGGHARLIESHLGWKGDDILYVGDHVFADVKMSKDLLRWRTCLVMRELEDDITSLHGFMETRDEIDAMMLEKEQLEHRFSVLRLRLQRKERGYGPPVSEDASSLKASMQTLREDLVALDARIAPLAKAAGQLRNQRWGPLMRAGNDKSHLARQIERYADIYTSRVSNLLQQTPFVYLRSPRGSLPHDPDNRPTATQE